MVPRGGIQVSKIMSCFQILREVATAAVANRNTNKIFLWIGSVPDEISPSYAGFTRFAHFSFC